MATEAELKQWLSTQPECKLQFILIYLTLKYVYLSNLFWLVTSPITVFNLLHPVLAENSEVLLQAGKAEVC